MRVVEVGGGHEENPKRKKGGEDSIVMDGHDLLDLASLETQRSCTSEELC
jgi:hypothetical protein